MVRERRSRPCRVAGEIAAGCTKQEQAHRLFFLVHLTSLLTHHPFTRSIAAFYDAQPAVVVVAWIVRTRKIGNSSI